MATDTGFCCSCIIWFFTVVIPGFVALIIWASFQPHNIRATVGSATLTNLTVSNATVSYHLAVSLNLYNPSLRVNIYYDTLDAVLRFGGAVLGPANDTSPTEFYQLRKSGDDVKVEFDGRGVAVTSDMAAELEKEIKGEGAVSLEVAIDARVRYRFNSIKARLKPRIRCWMRIPVKAERSRGGVGGVLASGDRCSVKYE